MNEESITLLRKCVFGCKMATCSIETVLPKVSGEDLRGYLENLLSRHNEYLLDINKFLFKNKQGTVEPNMMAKTMNKMTTEYRLMKDESDEKIATLILNGTVSAINSLEDYKKQYKGASLDAKDYLNNLIMLENSVKENIVEYV